jgi:hypothetical protein
MVNDTTAGRWFRRVMWLGIAANLALALPTLAAPAQMLAFSSLPTATPDLWPRFAALLLVLLSVFYIPAGLDIDRYRATAWFAVGSRLAGVVFFLLEPAEYRLFAWFDLAFFVPLAALLVVAVRRARTAAPRAVGATTV